MSYRLNARPEVSTALLEAADRLVAFSESGRIVPELNNPATREVIVGNYRVMYDLGGDVVRILTMLHGARQFPPGT